MSKPLSIVCVQVANGYSPEFRVWDMISRSPSSDLAATVLFNYWDANSGDAARFHALASRSNPPQIHGIDFGWRSVAAGRGLVERVVPHLRMLKALPLALRKAKAAKPDVIYSSQQHWDCHVATYLAKRLGVPQIIHLHYHVGEWLRKPVLSRLKSCDQVIAISEFIRQEALRNGVAPDRVTTILNTADPTVAPPPGTREGVRAELGVSDNAPFWGNISRLDPQKGQEDILHAFAQVLVRFPDARLLIVGAETPWHPGYGAHLQAVARQLGIDNSVIFAGFRSDVPRILAALDGFLHPSFKEPFGLAVIEAAQAGLPVIAYADGGIPEIIQHGVAGLLPARSAGDKGLAEAWAHLIAHPDSARTMGSAGRACVTSSPFVPEFAAGAFLETVRRVVQSGSSSQVKHMPIVKAIS